MNNYIIHHKKFIKRIPQKLVINTVLAASSLKKARPSFEILR